MPTLARLADAACEGVIDPNEAGLRVGKLAVQEDPPIDPPGVEALLRTFTYILQPAPVEALPDARLEPLHGPSAFPAALRDADDDLRQLWRELADEVRHPVARARCWDIVFTLKLVPNGRASAGRAIRAYLDVADTANASEDRRDKAIGLLRAWTLARLVKYDKLTAEITTAMMLLAEDAVTHKDDPDAAVLVLGALTAPAPRGASHAADSAADDLLDRALAAYPQVHVIKGLATLVRKSAAAGSLRAEQASRHEVSAMLAEAEAATDPLIIRTRFNDAAAAARRLRLTDLEQVAVTRLQSAPRISWSVFEHAVTIPPAYLRHYLRGFDQAADWRHALWIWLHTSPPTGNLQANEAQARQILPQLVFSRIARQTEFRDADLPARHITGDDTLLARELVRQETYEMDIKGISLARALQEIPRRFALPARDELESFLGDTFKASATLVRALARAIHLYWVGEYDACSHLIVPKVEAAARGLLLELSEPVYRSAVGDAIGQFPGLGSLLPLLVDNDFDPDWERFLRTFLLNDGRNVRNLVAHGFAHNTDPVEAALAIRAGALLILLTAGPAAERDTATVRSALATPTGAAPRRPWHRRLGAAFVAARHELRR
ncbi:DUF7380 domain-containing protein [Micromonospora echinaurantiaca]|uniref:DUF7380 domain-containing protein n=1 Tax=Micromonospora echinaurantiaca TaxID=47857 RepID=UPI0037914613